jgi:hypothetical protein
LGHERPATMPSDPLAGWGEMVAALALFLAAHIVPARPQLRNWLAARLYRPLLDRIARVAGLAGGRRGPGSVCRVVAGGTVAILGAPDRHAARLPAGDLRRGNA